MSSTIDFFFFIGSTYTYLSVMRVDAAAQAAGLEVAWRPFSVRTLMQEMNNIPFAGKPVKETYMWRDLRRRAGRLGLDYADDPIYPVDPEELANRVAVVAQHQGWCPAYVKATYRHWFLEGRGPGLDGNVAAVLAGLGRNAEAVTAEADSEEIRAAYGAATDRARQLGIFGSPSFVVGNEVFWGDDRLEEALDWARRPWVAA